MEHRAGPPLLWSQVRELAAWRRTLWEARLVGQDAARYEGAGYGNVSRRLGPLERPPGRRRFVITGTQTGGLPALAPAHFAVVEAYDPAHNRVVSAGPILPSSEAMTHGAVYDAAAEVRWVFHVHSPEIWQQARTLGVPATRPDVPYGSPEMAAEVARLFRETQARRLGLFVMKGHEDGVVAFGATAEDAAAVLARYHEGACRLTPCPVVYRGIMEA